MSTGVTVEIKADGLDQLGRALGVLVGKFEDLTPLMEDVAAHLEATTVERFSTNVGPDGQAWKKSIRAQLDGGLTLVQRGLLRDSIVSAAGPDWAEVGTNDPRARIHQLGGEIKPVTAPALSFTLPGVEGVVHAKKVVMPARPFLGVSNDDEKEIGGIIADYLLGEGRWAA